MQRLVDGLPAGEERAATMAAIAQIDMLNSKSVDGIEWAERAIGEAEQVGAKAVRAQAMVERATALTDVPERRDEGIAGSSRRSTRPSSSRTGCSWHAPCTTSATSCTAPTRLAVLERMRDAGRRAGFDNMVDANYYIRLADTATCEGDAATAWDNASRGR